MTTTKYFTEHEVFIDWFKHLYPQLSRLHSADILPAVDETGFIIKRENMDKEMEGIIRQIIKEYYRLINE